MKIEYCWDRICLHKIILLKSSTLKKRLMYSQIACLDVDRMLFYYYKGKLVVITEKESFLEKLSFLTGRGVSRMIKMCRIDIYYSRNTWFWLSVKCTCLVLYCGETARSHRCIQVHLNGSDVTQFKRELHFGVCLQSEECDWLALSQRTHLSEATAVSLTWSESTDKGGQFKTLVEKKNQCLADVQIVSPYQLS